MIAWNVILVAIALGGSVASQQEPTAGRASAGSDYVLGPDDEIRVDAIDAPELSGKSYRIDNSGHVGLPLVGRFQAAGMTSAGLEAELASRLSAFVLQPRVSVTLTELRSQPVSVVGSVNNPGTIQIRGSKSLMEVLAQAGGLKADAGYRLRIARPLISGRIPLQGEFNDSTGGYSMVEIPLKGLITGSDPAANIPILPHDVITVPRGEVFYVVGDVAKSGGYVMGENESMSALQALALAGGLAPNAAPKNSRLLRNDAGKPDRREIAVDLKAILAGKSPDVMLKPDDILFVPSNTPKKVIVRAIEAAVQTGSGIAIWRSSGRY
jgi:polysaccharide biosynthesis/export protein